MNINRQPGPPEKAPTPERVRFSIINTVNRIRVQETGETMQIVMRNKKAWEQNGERKYQALGGAAKMTPEGKSMLTERFDAEFGTKARPQEEADDARFFVEVLPDEREKKLAEIIDLFSKQDPSLFEDDVLREAHEDLVSDGVLSEEEFKTIRAHYEGLVSPINWKTTTSERETKGIPSRRLFHLFELEVPQALIPKLETAETLRVLSPSDIEDINAATREGNPAAKTKDGAIIVENIFL